MTTRGVIGSVLFLDGTAAEGDTVRFHQERVGFAEDAIYMPRDVTTVIQSDGDIERRELWASAEGGRNILCVMPNGYTWRFMLEPGDTDITLQELHALNAPLEPAVSPTIQSLITEATAEAVTIETAALVTAIGTEATVRAAADSAESSTRAAADATLQSNVTAEATARASADTAEATARAAISAVYRSAAGVQGTNVIVGYSGNTVGGAADASAVLGGGISGSINSIATGAFNLIVAGYDNQITSTGIGANTIGGGAHHRISDTATHGTVAGGSYGTISGTADYGAISGGTNNTIDTADTASIGGGSANSIESTGSAGRIGGGSGNVVAGNSSSVGGGVAGIIASNVSRIGGGSSNATKGSASTIGGGLRNSAGPVVTYTQAQAVAGVAALTVTDGAFVVGDVGATVYIQGCGVLFGTHKTTIAGYTSATQITLTDAPILSRADQVITIIGTGTAADYATVAGGFLNAAGGIGAAIGGGRSNTANGTYASIAGGFTNTASALQASIGGGTLNTASGSNATIAGGASNQATTQNAAVGGGTGNQATASAATIAGGNTNTAGGSESSIGGGNGNSAGGIQSRVGGGLSNSAAGNTSTVGGGSSNTSTGASSTVAGGNTNTATNQFSSIGGGFTNTTTGDYATVPGGRQNVASASYAQAMGFQGKADKYGQRAQASGVFSANGDAQSSVCIMRRQTTNGTAGTSMLLDGGSARLTIADDTTWMFTINIVARRTDADNESAAYKIEGCIDRNAGTVALVGTITKTVIAEDTVAWDVSASADDTNKALAVTVTGEAAKTINWVARVTLVEVTG